MFPAAAATTRITPSGNPGSTRRRRRDEGHDDNCSFCGQVPAAVIVQMPVLFRKTRNPTAYCSTCYYTTSAVRQDSSKYVSIASQEQVDAQLSPMQQLFSEAFIDLRKQLQEESDKAFSKQKSDPLAMLHSGSGLAPRRMARAPIPGEPKKDGHSADGGFLRTVPLPERLLRAQKVQAGLLQAQISRMKELENESATNSVYKRRKSSKKSIWNLAMDLNTKSVDSRGGENAARDMELAPSCSCGSSNVRSMGNTTSRNQDLKKGETWGMKDRGEEVMFRYQCNGCGKMWNEEG